MIRIRKPMLFLVGVLVCTSAFAEDSALWAQLKRGGYVILMRHGPVDSITHSTHPRADFENCVGQNNLSPEGQQEVARMGRAFKKKRVPVGEVLASPFCRTQDTARIAFGRARVWDALDLQTDLAEDEATQRSAQVAARIGQFKGRKNLVLVTHQPNIDSLTLELVERGTILVLKPAGGSNFNVVGRIALEDLP